MMLKLCVDYYEAGRKQGIDIKALTLYDNLKPLQEAIEKEEGRKYSLAELADTIRYCHRWTR